MQEIALYVTVLTVAAVLLVFVLVVLSTRQSRSATDVAKTFVTVRCATFAALTIVMIPIVAFSLRELPYAPPPDTTSERQIVEVTGHQLRWELSTTELKAGIPVEFRVTAADVNHGFGLYDESLRIIAQTQAMPEYVNVVHHTFAEPGSYRILCLEYCGLVHHAMMAEISVR